MFILDASNDIDVLRKFDTHFSHGHIVRCMVTAIDSERGSVDLSLKAAEYLDSIGDDASKKIKSKALKQLLGTAQVGSVCLGRVESVSANGMFYNVQIASHEWARLSFFELADSLPANPGKHYSQKQIVKCRVLEEGKKHCVISTRDSKVDEDGDADVVDPCINSIKELEELDTVRGYVMNASVRPVCVVVCPCCP